MKSSAPHRSAIGTYSAARCPFADLPLHRGIAMHWASIHLHNRIKGVQLRQQDAVVTLGMSAGSTAST